MSLTCDRCNRVSAATLDGMCALACRLRLVILTDVEIQSIRAHIERRNHRRTEYTATVSFRHPDPIQLSFAPLLVHEESLPYFCHMFFA